ncbi:MAG: hypothetical protein LBQ52_01980 [Helicobacteraceae bacterium]|jgi:uncharacterized protein HemY|nr:hypothetical protein [Helicobacteraceae bacterium]
MNAGIYINKAEALLQRKTSDWRSKIEESLQKAIATAKENDDFASLIQAQCFLGESLFMRGEYKRARESLSFAVENAKTKEDFDDMFDQEIASANLLILLIDRYA